jgi:hypothetical protein
MVIVPARTQKISKGAFMGRPRKKKLTDGLPILNATTLRAISDLPEGRTFSYSWPSADLAAFGAVREGCVEIDGTTITLDRVAVRLGGRRLYLRCPSCRSRRTDLYRIDGSFRCRRCAGLTYASTRESPIFRALRRVRKFRALLDGSDACDPFPARPPRMGWRRYRRLLEKLLAAHHEHRRLIRLKHGPIIDALRKMVRRT